MANPSNIPRCNTRRRSKGISKHEAALFGRDPRQVLLTHIFWHPQCARSLSEVVVDGTYGIDRRIVYEVREVDRSIRVRQLEWWDHKGKYYNESAPVVMFTSDKHAEYANMITGLGEYRS